MAAHRAALDALRIDPEVALAKSLSKRIDTILKQSEERDFQGHVRAIVAYEGLLPVWPYAQPRLSKPGKFDPSEYERLYKQSDSESLHFTGSLVWARLDFRIGALPTSTRRPSTRWASPVSSMNTWPSEVIYPPYSGRRYLHLSRASSQKGQLSAVRSITTYCG